MNGYGSGAIPVLGGPITLRDGLLVHKFGTDGATYDGDSDSKFTYQFGGGLDIPLKSIGLWIDIRCLSRAEDSPTTVVPIMAGIYIPLGSK